MKKKWETKKGRQKVKTHIAIILTVKKGRTGELSRGSF